MAKTHSFAVTEPTRTGAARAPSPRGPPPEDPARRGRAAAVADDGRRRAARGRGLGGDLSPRRPCGRGRAGRAAASVGTPRGALGARTIEDRMTTNNET